MATIGTTSGSDFSGLNDAMKYNYSEAFENNIEKEQEVMDAFKAAGDFKVIDGPDGKGVQIQHTFHSGGGFSAGLEDDYLPTNTNPSIKQSTITLKKLTAAVQLSGQALRRVKEGPAAFATWANEALPRRAQTVAWHADRMALGFGNGIIGRVNDATPGTDLIIDAAFGVAGLEGATRLVRPGDSLRFSPNANGTTPRTAASVVASIDHDASTLTVNAIDGSLADDDYIFIGDANVYGLGAREVTGLENIIDNGVLAGTFQTLSRTSYPQLKAQQIDASASPWNATLSEELLDYAATQAWERAGGMIDLILTNRGSQRAFWKSLKGDRVFNDPRGDYMGGKNDKGLKMLLGTKVVTIRAARKVPDSRAYLIDSSSIRKYQLGKGKWDDTTGSVWERAFNSTGRYDAYVAFYIQEMELGCGDPARNVKITGLASA